MVLTIPRSALPATDIPLLRPKKPATSLATGWARGSLQWAWVRAITSHRPGQGWQPAPQTQQDAELVAPFYPIIHGTCRNKISSWPLWAVGFKHIRGSQELTEQLQVSEFLRVSQIKLSQKRWKLTLSPWCAKQEKYKTPPTVLKCPFSQNNITINDSLNNSCFSFF